MRVCSIGPHDKPTDEENVAKFYDGVTGLCFLKHCVSAARQEQIKFLNKFPVYKKVQEANAKSKKRVSVRWCGVNKGDCNNMGLWYENLRGKIHSCTARLVPLHHWKVPGLSVIESRFVDVDIGGNWSSKCSCHKHLESVSIRQLWVNCTSLCRRKTQHSARVDKLFEGSMGARRGCDFVEKDGCSRVSSGNEQSLHLHFAKKKMVAVGCLMGPSSLCICMYTEEPSMGWRHGDDILFAGVKKFVDGIFDKLKGEWILNKRAKLRFAENDEHCSILNRLIDLTLRKNGPIILFEQDPGHVKLLLEHLEFVKTKVTGEKSGTCYDETDFEKSKVKLNRSCVMRFAILSADLPRRMHKPTIRHWSRLKIVARYLRTHGRWIQQYRRREPTRLLDTFADADCVRGVSWSEVATVPKRKSHRGLDLDLSLNSEVNIWKGWKENGGTK